MSDDSKKSIVFVKPISENLEKLYEILQEQEEVNTLLVGSYMEAIALIKAVSPALFLTSSAKVCLNIGVKKANIFKKNQNKIFLLSQKNFP